MGTTGIWGAMLSSTAFSKRELKELGKAVRAAVEHHNELIEGVSGAEPLRVRIDGDRLYCGRYAAVLIFTYLDPNKHKYAGSNVYVCKRLREHIWNMIKDEVYEH